ncbi:MAG TPA: amidohydrolase family protein, partial [Dermatophilaceae bacterium]|nr:amidohydrolase family protein [Dermatophilaceae bacterium]
ADTIDSFAAQGIAIVPTLVNIGTFPSIAAGAQDKYPIYAAHLLDLHSRRYATVASAHDAGLPVYLGTDAGGSLPHGLVAREAAELVRAGLTAVEALSAASWGARSWLRRPGLEEGASADLVIYQADPREDIGILAAPEHIVMGGAVVR